MTYEVNDQHFEQILSEPAGEQYGYFLGACAQQGEVWGLAVDGADWAQVDDEEDGVYRFAVWPHPRFAEACRQQEEWAGHEPTPIRLENFIGELIPKLLDEGTGLAVFPLPDGRYTPVDPERVRDDLQDHLDGIEDPED